MSYPREGSREIDDGIIVSEAMDWCKSPTEPVPYRIWAKQVDAANLANSVRLTDDRAHVVASLVLQCQGDDAGVGGGVLSGTHNAECEPLTYSPTVRAEGRNMVRHHDFWFMNHKNTYGRLTYIKDPNSYPTPQPRTIARKIQLAFDQKPGTATDAPLPGIGGTSTASAPIESAAPLATTPTDATPSTVPATPMEAPPTGTPKVPSVPLNPYGPGMMDLMGHVDRWLKDNVNEPEDWWSKGFKRKDTSTKPTPKSEYYHQEMLKQEGVIRSTNKCPSFLICFFPKTSKYDKKEFDKQLSDQQKELDSFSPTEWQNNRNAVIKAGSTDSFRNTPQARQAYNNTYLGLQKAQAQYPGQDLAALHRLDIVAGGYGDRFSGLGPSQENSLIGSLWSQGKGVKGGDRLANLYELSEILKANDCPKMTAILRRCTS